MKVLHVIDSLGVGGGAEHSLAATLPLLRDRGVENVVATLIPREGGLQARLVDEGFELHVLAGSWPSRIRALRGLVRRTKPDFVSATLVNSCLVSRVALVGTGTPLLNSLVNTTYDPAKLQRLGAAPWKVTALRTIDRVTAQHLVTHFHALTEAVATEAVEVLGVPPGHVTVIPRGRPEPDLPEDRTELRAEVRRELGIDGSAPIVLNVGRQDEQKAQDRLVRAFAEVRRSHPDAVLVIVGREGDASAHLRTALEETGVADAVRLPGHRNDVYRLYASADVYAFPSLWEGFGGTLIEAMAAGTAIVGSDAPAIAEVLGDGRYGRVVPRHDTSALAREISELLADPTERATVGRAGRRRFEERYRIDRVAEDMYSLFDRVAAHGRRRTGLVRDRSRAPRTTPRT